MFPAEGPAMLAGRDRLRAGWISGSHSPARLDSSAFKDVGPPRLLWSAHVADALHTLEIAVLSPQRRTE